MGYVDENLMPGEEVLYRATLHWIVFVAPTFLAFAGLVIAVPFMVREETAALGGFGILLFLMGVVILVSRFILFKTSEFAVTTKRVLIKVGFVRRHSLELLLTKVEGIGVDQSILGRICSFGTIVVTGTGGTKETFKNISQPLEFRKRVQAQVPA
jgi:uncharacterized membrane protein YdbT with pleckstrin-like domain